MLKLYDEFIKLEIDDLKPFAKDPKGELTIVISEKKNIKKISQVLGESDKRSIKKMIKNFSIKEIVGIINKDNKIPKKIIYNYCLKVKNEN